MKGKKKLNLLILFLGLLIIPMVVYGKDYTYYYDELLKNNELVFNTDVSLTSDTNSYYLENIINNFLSGYSINYSDISGTSYYFYLSGSGCNQEELTCNIYLYLGTSKDNKYDTKTLKTYKDVSLKTNSEGIDEYFTSYIKNDNLVINYDESMFSNESDRQNYASRYVSKGNVYGISYSKTFGLSSYPTDFITYFEKEDNLPKVVAIKKINEIKFEYKEEAFSDDFKALTSSNELTIKTNGEINERLLNSYLNSFYFSGSNFDIDGEIVNNKVYIVRSKYVDGENKVVEKHLINLKKADVDVSLFEQYGLKDTFKIYSDLKYDNSSFLSNYTNLFYYYSYSEDGKTNVNVSTDWYLSNISQNEIGFRYKKVVDNAVVDIQFYYLPIEYVGYTKETSEEFKKDIGDKVVIKSNEKSLDTVDNAVGSIKTNGYNYKVTACNDDYTKCDIALRYYDNSKIIEVHSVNIVFDDSMSDWFKEAFNIDNDMIDIIMSEDVVSSNISLYMYNDDTRDSYSYNCYNGKCTLTLRNYYENKYEQHKIDLNYMEKGKTDYYKKNVVDSKVIYPGENKSYASSLYGTNNFSKDKNFYSYSTNCDSERGYCLVYILTENYGIEVHRVNVITKEGKSPEFESLLPGDTIEVPYVKVDDEDYIYTVLSSYLTNILKSDVYISNYDKENNKILVYYNNLESHTFTIKFAESNKVASEAIDKAVDNINKQDNSFVVEDLDLVNSFYYSSTGMLDMVDTSSIYNKMTKIIDNNHITYKLFTWGGMGTSYLGLASGRVALFYDGVGYGMTDDVVSYTTRYVLHIPSDTKDTTEDYIKAAQKRIDDYLGKDNGVEVQYVGPIDEDILNFDHEEYGDLPFIDFTKTDGNEYKLVHKDKVITIVIMKDDTKLEEPEFVSKDVNNNVVVKSDNVNYPMDTVVTAVIMEEDTKEFKEILKKVKSDNAQVIDISLYSPSTGDITDFEGAKFTVTVPLTNKNLEGKKLVAYYLDDEGNIVSEHPVTVEDGMATFETTHFSTYVIAEKKDTILDKLPQIPNTLDAIIVYLGVFVLAVAGIITSTKYLKRKN